MCFFAAAVQRFLLRPEFRCLRVRTCHFLHLDDLGGVVEKSSMHNLVKLQFSAFLSQMDTTSTCCAAWFRK